MNDLLKKELEKNPDLQIKLDELNKDYNTDSVVDKVNSICRKNNNRVSYLIELYTLDDNLVNRLKNSDRSTWDMTLDNERHYFRIALCILNRLDFETTVEFRFALDRVSRMKAEIGRGEDYVRKNR